LSSQHTHSLDNWQLFNNSVDISLLFCGKWQMNFYKDAKCFYRFGSSVTYLKIDIIKIVCAIKMLFSSDKTNYQKQSATQQNLFAKGMQMLCILLLFLAHRIESLNSRIEENCEKLSNDFLLFVFFCCT